VAQKTNTSSGYLSRLLSGKLKLSQTKLEDFAHLFELNEDEESYLSLLVSCDEAEGDEKISLFRELLERRGIRLTYLDDSSFGIYGAWYLPVLREVFALAPLDWSDEVIGQMLKPKISAETVNLGRERLLELGLLEVLPSGGYKRAERLIASGERPHLSLRHYAEDCMALGRRALVEEPLESREFSFLTLSVSQESQTLVIEKLRQLRRELLDLVALERKPDRVMQVQLHFLPVSSSWKEDAES
jgi:uncharacterized protein (TIGR02147 family)